MKSGMHEGTHRFVGGKHLRPRWTGRYLEWVGFLSPSQNAPSEGQTLGVQDLCKHPSVLPYPLPLKVKIHKMAAWEQPPP